MIITHNYIHYHYVCSKHYNTTVNIICAATADIIRKHGLSFHHYADDLQMYTYFEYDHHSFSTSLVKLQCCVSELQKWFSANHLIMNEGKTEFILFLPKPYHQIVDKSTICIGDDVIRASISVTDLGVVLDRHLKMSHQVSKDGATMHL